MSLHPKVAASGLAASITTLVVAILAAAGVSVPPELASAAVTVLTFAVGYLTPQPTPPGGRNRCSSILLLLLVIVIVVAVILRVLGR